MNRTTSRRKQPTGVQSAVVIHGRCWDGLPQLRMRRRRDLSPPISLYYRLASSHSSSTAHAGRRRNLVLVLPLVCISLSRTASEAVTGRRLVARPAPQTNCEEAYERRRGRGWMQRRISVVPGWAYLHGGGTLSLAACWASMGLGCVPMCPMSQLESRTHYRRPSSCSWA